MKGNAEKCVVEGYSAFAERDFTALQPAPTPCVDDHLIPPEDFEAKNGSSLPHVPRLC